VIQKSITTIVSDETVLNSLKDLYKALTPFMEALAEEKPIIGSNEWFKSPIKLRCELCGKITFGSSNGSVLPDTMCNCTNFDHEKAKKLGNAEIEKYKCDRCMDTGKLKCLRLVSNPTGMHHFEIDCECQRDKFIEEQEKRIIAHYQPKKTKVMWQGVYIKGGNYIQGECLLPEKYHGGRDLVGFIKHIVEVEND
jgi:hypothetical protein